MNFDVQSVTSCVMGLARKLIPGWLVTVELAPSIEANQGALAMVYSTPERQLAHVVVAPHPPSESIEESIAHELTHAVLSPLTKLIAWSDASVMLEEQIVERLGKLIASAPTSMSRAISKALQNPRTNSPTVRKRISALAIGRRNGTRKRMDSKALAALAMEGGALTAAETPNPAAMADFIKRIVEALAGGEEPASTKEPAMAKEPDEESAKKEQPAMREEDMPPKMRQALRQLKQGNAMMLESTIRMRLHEARTIDNIALDAETENDLKQCETIEQFQREFKLVTRSRMAATETQRKRSGVVADDSDDKTHGHSIASLVKDGHSEEMATHIVSEFKRGKDFGDTALVGAMKFRKVAKNG